jgi:hypothetical protein
MRFSDVDKLGVFCDDLKPSTEQRHDAEVRVITLTLRMQPLTAVIAHSIDPLLRRLLFKSGAGNDPVPNLREATIALDVPRQLLVVHATRDSNGSIAFDQVKIGRLRARLAKDVDGWALIFKVTFGPCSAAELVYAHSWVGGQRFVTFGPAEGELQFDDQAEAPEPEAEPEPEVDGGEVAPEAPRRSRRPRAHTH